MKIGVTEEDIKNGKKENPTSCPIALAIKRACGLTTEIYPRWQTPGEVYIYMNPNQGIKVSLPMGIARRALVFDVGGQMEPFDFDLEIPE